MKLTYSQDPVTTDHHYTLKIAHAELVMAGKLLTDRDKHNLSMCAKSELITNKLRGLIVLAGRVEKDSGIIEVGWTK